MVYPVDEKVVAIGREKQLREQIESLKVQRDKGVAKNIILRRDADDLQAQLAQEKANPTPGVKALTEEVAILKELWTKEHARLDEALRWIKDYSNIEGNREWLDELIVERSEVMKDGE